MSDTTTIEWTDRTFNPWEGCQKVGPGCDHCYAETRNARFGGGRAVNWGPGAPRRRTSAANWRKPLRWNAQADAFFADHGRRQRVFCASLADVFDNAVDSAWRADLFYLIEKTPNLDWLLLTKRIANVVPMISEISQYRLDLECLEAPRLPENVWLGSTIVNQTEADRDIPKLLATPARVKFLSMEPLLGPVDISDWLAPSYPRCPSGFSQGEGMSEGYCGACTGHVSDPIHDSTLHDFLDWVILGGESGRDARPMNPKWATSLRDQCSAAGVPFLFKQWGEWYPVSIDSVDDTIVLPDGSASRLSNENGDSKYRSYEWSSASCDPVTTYSVSIELGRRRAGRLLDGRLHDGFPPAVAA